MDSGLDARGSAHDRSADETDEVDDPEWLDPEDLTDEELGVGEPLPPFAIAVLRRRERERFERARRLPDEPVPEEPEVTPDGIGGVVRAVRWRAGLSQRELAAESGVPGSTVIRLETEGTSDLKLSTLVRLIGAVGLHLAVVDDEGTHLALPYGQGRFHDHAYRLLPAHCQTYDPRRGYWWGKGLLQQPDPRHPMPARVSRGRRRPQRSASAGAPD